MTLKMLSAYFNYNDIAQLRVILNPAKLMGLVYLTSADGINYLPRHQTVQCENIQRKIVKVYVNTY